LNNQWVTVVRKEIKKVPDSNENEDTPESVEHSKSIRKLESPQINNLMINLKFLENKSKQTQEVIVRKGLK
jgi:hypothetical protein